MNANTFLQDTNRFIVFGLLLTALLVGKSITVSAWVPLIVVAGLFAFLIGFVYSEQVMLILILAMLLSPEIILGTAGHRDIVVRVEDLLILVFFLAWLARTAVLRHAHFVFKTPIQNSILLYSSLFVMATAYGIMSGSVRMLEGVFYILKYIEYFMIYYLVIALVKNKNQVKTYSKALIFVFFVVSLYALSQIGTGSRVSAPFEGPGEPNTLGGYMILMMAVIIGLLAHVRQFRWRWFVVGMTILAMIPFAFTLSRASYIAFIPMYLTLIYFMKHRARNVLIGILFLVIILGIFFFPENVKQRIQYTFVPQVQETIEPVKVGSVTLGPSASARIRSWINVFNAWKHKPVLGYGVTGLGFIDGQFMRTLGEVGMLGLLAFITLLINIFRHTLRIYKSTRDDWLKGLALGFLAGHVGMIFHALTANTFIIIRIMEPYWFLAAMVMMIPIVDDKPKEIDPAQKKPLGGPPRMTDWLLSGNKAAL